MNFFWNSFFTFFISFSAWAQVEVVNFEEFEQGYMNKKCDTLYVINFWATWCKPCVAELPYFEEARKEFSNHKMKIILVSLDFSTNLKTKLLPFLEKMNVESKVILMDDLDYDKWIDKISPGWSGAIPGTLFLNRENGINIFREGEFERETLFSQIFELL
jgi:thiol-disulfide isomerase/thioredoxin